MREARGQSVTPTCMAFAVAMYNSLSLMGTHASRMAVLRIMHACRTPEAEALSSALKKAGMKFVGPTTCYAFMQAAGLVNDHTMDCYCYKQINDGYQKHV